MAEFNTTLVMPQPSGGNDPPAEPEAFRLLAPQRGLIATEQKQTPCTAQRGPSRSHARRPEKAHCRNCQTATSSPTEPGGLSCWASGDKRLKLARQHTETGNRRTPATAATGLPTLPGSGRRPRRRPALVLPRRFVGLGDTSRYFEAGRGLEGARGSRRLPVSRPGAWLKSSEPNPRDGGG
jgi:hypothetical protein